MTQLILDVGGLNVVLPESRKGGYKPDLVPLHKDVEMVSGRMVRELRGNVWQLSYQYNYFKPAMRDLVIAACQTGRRQPIICSFLIPEGEGAMKQSRFFVTAFKHPKFYWSRDEHGVRVPLWGDFSLTLREVKPSD